MMYDMIGADMMTKTMSLQNALSTVRGIGARAKPGDPIPILVIGPSGARIQYITTPRHIRASYIQTDFSVKQHTF